MDLNDALAQISDIRHHVHRSGVFRGYRAMTTAFSGCVALGAAMFQALWLPRPAEYVDFYLFIWMSAGIICVGAAALVIYDRCRLTDSSVQRELAMHAIEQLMPCLVAGGLLTVVLAEFSLPSTVLLPGLWSILLGLGVFASRRLLPRATALVGGYYLLAGLLILAEFRGIDAFSPWVMGVTFSVGQFLAAGVLWWTLERSEMEADHGLA